MPTFVTAHTFCASRNTRVSYVVVPIACEQTSRRAQAMVSTNTGIFLRDLKLGGESRTWQVLLVSKKKIWGNHAFFIDNKAFI